eukprot:6722221-Pyramimonas_sp.AAC.1
MAVGPASETCASARGAMRPGPDAARVEREGQARRKRGPDSGGNAAQLTASVGKVSGSSSRQLHTSFQAVSSRSTK